MSEIAAEQSWLPPLPPSDVRSPGAGQRAYLTATMDRVSRSFALVVPCLEDPLQDYFATAYLLCRALDNIEDCEQPLAWQKQRFAEFRQLLAAPDLAPVRLAEWESSAWPGLSADERTLMTTDGGQPLWSIYSGFPSGTRAILQTWIPLMADGMESVLDPEQPPQVVIRDDVRVLASADSYNDYCYAVAGTVGGLGTELVIEHYKLPGALAQTLLKGSEACGRALQKTNVLKDFAEDLQRRICYLPDEWLALAGHAPLALSGAPAGWVADLLGDILTELRDATAYVLDVPQHAVGYRTASLMCLFPAYETVRLAAQRRAELFTADHHVKIDRPTMARCAADAVAVATDDEAILRMSRELDEATREALSAG